MWLKWLPWRFLIRKGAHAGGFIDPVALLSKLARFSQPSEVAEPLELLRAGVVFHARGLINTKAIQHNLDWIWPYWVERQFDPEDESFLPRAFSITHVNLTHRNWTAVGLPGLDAFPIVDPRGLITPHFDGWSIDFWLSEAGGAKLFPSQLLDCEQRLVTGADPYVETSVSGEAGAMRSVVKVEKIGSKAVMSAKVVATSPRGAWLAAAIRPYNPEGVSFIHDISADQGGRSWLVNQEESLSFSESCAAAIFSRYERGDVAGDLDEPEKAPTPRAMHCEVGLATAAALYRVDPGASFTLEVTAELRDPEGARRCKSWAETLPSAPAFEVPHPLIQKVSEACLHSLILHAPLDIYPGPFTYKRFWFRDAAFIIYGLAAWGLFEQAERAIARFPSRQTWSGYMLSQEGEWDSNGEALWAMRIFSDLSGQPLDPDLLNCVKKAANWITGKRLTRDRGKLHEGLLPAGFSAEHLGPNDFYYWDNFWGVAGLDSAARLCERAGDHGSAASFARQADDFKRVLLASIARSVARSRRGAIPASPYRRMDAGAIGSVAGSYPLGILEPRDQGMLNTLEYLMASCFHRGAFFQDMIHSGMNAYLTLHIAQALMRAGDSRAFDLMETVAGIASPTGHWPEAVHPRTLGGCMGDGQHSWASAEWLLMLRNMFVREEGDALVLCSGLPSRWLEPLSKSRFGPAPTRFGAIEVNVEAGAGSIDVSWRAEWRGRPPRIELRLAGFPPRDVTGRESAELRR